MIIEISPQLNSIANCFGQLTGNIGDITNRDFMMLRYSQCTLPHELLMRVNQYTIFAVSI